MTPANLIISILFLFYGCAKNTFTEAPPSTLQFGTDETLDIITWNIEQFPKSNLTVEYLSQLIIDLDADIVALQEIGSATYFNNLINTLDGWDGERTSGSYALAYIYKSDLSILDIYEIDELNKDELTRTPYMLELNWKNDIVYIINNHYKCCGDGIINYSNSSDEEYKRLRSIQLTKTYLDTFYTYKSVVLLGDLNDEINDSESNNVFTEFIEDTHYDFTDYDIAMGGSSNWSYPTWPSHLDHILITNELFNNHDTTYTILAENFFSGWAEYESIISDHRPVGIRLKFGE
ncbi:MAG: endonuclease/exonuclease/phosphatase family protein [Candidatus Marinimicrobia bacterium]|nr:endonuclease/exonuclease/phosphatase family protein [Candidatus Neomarinimicrobiota bacterium]